MTLFTMKINHSNSNSNLTCQHNNYATQFFVIFAGSWALWGVWKSALTWDWCLSCPLGCWRLENVDNTFCRGSCCSRSSSCTFELCRRRSCQAHRPFRATKRPAPLQNFSITLSQSNFHFTTSWKTKFLSCKFFDITLRSRHSFCFIYEIQEGV